MSYKYENLYIMHYGVGHDKGGHSGRYPWGSGKNASKDYGSVDTSIDNKIFIKNHQQIDRDCLDIAKNYIKSTGKSISPDEMRYIKNNIRLMIRGLDFSNQLSHVIPKRAEDSYEEYRQDMNTIAMHIANLVSQDINLTDDNLVKYKYLNRYIEDYVNKPINRSKLLEYPDPGNTYLITRDYKTNKIQVNNLKK